MNDESSATMPHTVLLVDDDLQLRRNLGLLLRWSGGWQVVGEASGGAEALRLAERLHPALVLIDRWLEDGDGLGVVPRLRSLANPPVVVLLSGETDSALRRHAIGLGAAEWLEKTTSPVSLIATLRTLLELA